MSDARSPITTHVLDTALGRPARGVPVLLERATEDGYVEVGAGKTDDDGRVTDLLDPAGFVPGVYLLHFDTGAYFQATGRDAFYPEVAVLFRVIESGGHHHVPLLLSPYGYSTYRGS
jgi:5-hydroxyisourate hydrolase